MNENKNAFQWDAYRPLVDHIPACTVVGGCTCPGVVYLLGVYLPRRGVPAWGERVYLPGGYLPRYSPPPWSDRHL